MGMWLCSLQGAVGWPRMGRASGQHLQGEIRGTARGDKRHDVVRARQEAANGERMWVCFLLFRVPRREICGKWASCTTGLREFPWPPRVCQAFCVLLHQTSGFGCRNVFFNANLRCSGGSWWVCNEPLTAQKSLCLCSAKIFA